MMLLPLSLVLAAGGELPKSGPLDLEALLRQEPEAYGALLDRHEELRLQLCVAEVVERPDGSLGLERSTLGDLGVYFYPASSIKTAAAVAGLELLNEWNAERGTAFGLSTELTIEPQFEGERRRETDASNQDGGRITIGHELRKLSIVSDNEAYNRFYELVGQDRLDACLERAGFPSFHLVHRLSEARSLEENRRFPALVLHDPVSEERLELAARECDPLAARPEPRGLEAGRAHQVGDQVVEGPFRFHDKNRVDLVELQDFLVEVVRPEVETGRRGFPGLTVEQRAFLLEAMVELPRESANPVYDPEKYTDDYVKFLLPGLRRVLPPERIRVWNKVGLAYGFTIENAYVEDAATGRGFFVAAVLYTNPNEVVNDGRYGYDETAFPFHANLGETLGRHFLQPGEER